MEKVYTARFGSDHVPSPPKSYDISVYAANDHDLDHDLDLANINTNINWDTNIPPLQTFDSFFDAKSTVHLENNPLLFHHDGSHHNTSRDRTESTAFDTGNTAGFPNFPTSDEVFANNLGFAFSPDCLPSDYNMFDTLNQMYLEETW